MQVFANLAGQGRGLLDEAAAMPRSQPQLAIRRFQFQLTEPEPGYRRAVLRIQIRLIRLVARIGWHAVLLGGEGMDDARFESCAGEGSLRRQVIIPRPFDDDQRVLDPVRLLSLADQFDGQLEVRRSVLERSGLDEQVSKVIGHHPLRAMLGWIDADDGEPLAAYFLDAGTEDAVGLLQRPIGARLATALRTTVSLYAVRHLEAP